MAIPRKQLDNALIDALAGLPGVDLDTFIAALIITTLKSLRGNRLHTARALRIPLRSLRHKIRCIEALGYDVPASEFGGTKKG